MDDRTINAIEAVINVIYLIKHCADDPAEGRRMLTLLQPSVAVLRRPREVGLMEVVGSHNHPHIRILFVVQI